MLFPGMSLRMSLDEENSIISVDAAKHNVIPSVGGQHPIHWESEQNKNVKEGRELIPPHVPSFLCLPDCFN